MTLAVDVDTRNGQFRDTLALGEYLRRVLPPAWLVTVVSLHVHAEWDTARSPWRQAVSA